MSITYDITTCRLPRQETAVMRATMPAADLAGWLPEVYRTVAAYLERIGVDASGPPFARYVFLARDVAVEAGFAVATEVAGDGEVEPSFLPAGPAVITTHLGKYDGMGATCDAVQRWLDDHGRTTAGPHWEMYFTDSVTEPDPARWRTEIVVPYRTGHTDHA